MIKKYPNYPNYPFFPISMNKESKHKTIPAPRVLSDDPWFGPATISDANRIYLAQKEQEQKNTLTKENKEPDNIHELMYNISIKSITSVIDTSGRNWNSGG